MLKFPNFFFCIHVIFYLFDFMKSCQISGYSSGHCVASADYSSQIPFCSNYLYKYICVPYEFDLWKANYTITKRDQLVEQIFIQEIEKTLMLVLSTNPTNTAIGANRALIYDMTCYERYKEFLCAMNFLFCNEKTDTTLQICTEKCLNYVSACGYTNNLCTLNYVEYVH